MSRPVVRTLPGVLLWSLSALGIWLLTLSGLSSGELFVGAACSAVVGVIAIGIRQAVGTSWKPTGTPLRPFVVLPLAIASDTAQVLSLPLRRRRNGAGHFATVDIDAAGPSPRAATRRALATIATTVTPGSIVVDVDDKGVMTLHRLPTLGISVEEGFTNR